MSGRDRQLVVIVVNFHSARLIGRTIEIVREFAGAAARLIMVDNSPGDGAAGSVRAADPDALVVANPVNRGYAAAVNQAVPLTDEDALSGRGEARAAAADRVRVHLTMRAPRPS